LVLAAVAPLTRSSTRVTPTLSAAFTLTRIVFDTVPPVGDAIDTVGGVVSGGGPFKTLKAIAAEVVELPAASYATAVNATGPFGTVVEFHAN
jgi:hypothetical protein